MSRTDLEPPRLYDVTVTIRPEMPTYPGEPRPELAPVKRMAAGAQANVSRLSVGLHAGTHVDAPVHFIDGGAAVDALPLAAMCGPARVVEIHDRESVSVPELEERGLHGATRVLFKTRNSLLWNDAAFREEFVYLAPEAARWLLQHGVVLVGLDYLSIEAFGAAQPAAHRILLQAGVVVVEGLDLREPPPGEYDLWCLPLKIAGGDGAPARVVLSRSPAGRRSRP
jgi:arylformamidase